MKFKNVMPGYRFYMKKYGMSGWVELVKEKSPPVGYRKGDADYNFRHKWVVRYLNLHEILCVIPQHITDLKAMDLASCAHDYVKIKDLTLSNLLSQKFLANKLTSIEIDYKVSEEIYNSLELNNKND